MRSGVSGSAHNLLSGLSSGRSLGKMLQGHPRSPSGLSHPQLYSHPHSIFFPQVPPRIATAFCGRSQPLSTSPEAIPSLHSFFKTECQGNKPVAKCFDAPLEHPESRIPGRRPHGSPARGHRWGLHSESFELLLLFFAQLGTFCMFSPPASENRKI